MNAAIALAALVSVVAAARGTWSPCGLSMISAINPFTERSRGHRYAVTSIWFVLGSVIGGAMLGGAGALGAVLFWALHVPPAVVAPAAALCCLFTLAADAPFSRIRLPSIPRQVNERWLGGYRRWVYAAGFGLQIGAGLATYVMTGAVYLVPVLGVLSGSPMFALSSGLLFGLVRGLAILLGSRARTPEKLLNLHRILAATEQSSLKISMLIQACAALVFGWVGGALVLVAVVVVLTAGGIAGGLLHSRRSTVTPAPDARPGNPRTAATP